MFTLLSVARHTTIDAFLVPLCESEIAATVKSRYYLDKQIAHTANSFVDNL